ncbi:hypothetical protein GCM10025863_12160 [Microbacterium suwonense]|uniref:Phosphofructokinase domain-containing protein n=1 Tax=Microbacterium suwonense TaxID=683047 RepID=A0ABM8FSV5_9MICO|nr:hypothetical protein GCM10025863_12160 [Microbacterium suwonense]
MKIGILTSGGDCPGLNAVIRGIVLKGTTTYDLEFVGIRDGWRGVVDGDFFPLTRHEVKGLSKVGGTILGTSRTNPYEEAAGERRTSPRRWPGTASTASSPSEAKARLPPRTGWPRTASTCSACRRPSTTTCRRPTTPSASTPP